MITVTVVIISGNKSIISFYVVFASIFNIIQLYHLFFAYLYDGTITFNVFVLSLYIDSSFNSVIQHRRLTTRPRNIPPDMLLTSFPVT